jgi:hypothetical protein
VSEESSASKGSSFHGFLGYLMNDRVPNPHTDSVLFRCHPISLRKDFFYHTTQEATFLKDKMSLMILRVLGKYVDLEKMKPFAEKPFKHEFSEFTKEKSKGIGTKLLFLNENLSSDVAGILDHYEVGFLFSFCFLFFVCILFIKQPGNIL